MAKSTSTGVSSKTAASQEGAFSRGRFFTLASSMADRRPPGARRSNSSVRIPANLLRSLFLTKTMRQPVFPKETYQLWRSDSRACACSIRVNGEPVGSDVSCGSNLLSMLFGAINCPQADRGHAGIKSSKCSPFTGSSPREASGVYTGTGLTKVRWLIFWEETSAWRKSTGFTSATTNFLNIKRRSSNTSQSAGACSLPPNTRCFCMI